MDSTDLTQLMKLTVLARALGIHLTTAHRWRLSGLLPAVKVGGRWYADRACIEGLLQAPGRPRRPPPLAPKTPDWAKQILDEAKL